MSLPCNSRSLYSHRLSWFGSNTIYNNSLSIFTTVQGWTHVSADKTNKIDKENITQIPVVKAFGGVGYQVIKGPGSTGGDLVTIPPNAHVQIRVTGELQQEYLLRFRYACQGDGELFVYREVRTSTGMAADFSQFQSMPSTYFGGDLTYNAFSYQTMSNSLPGRYNDTDWWITIDNTGNTPIILDKMEFIPYSLAVNETVGGYELGNDLEKIRQTVDALFTNTGKHMLQLNVTDYQVDQAARLVECMSDEIYPKEKMCLLDHVKCAKRLSQARNLLHYGDFESPDWSGQDGWKTNQGYLLNRIIRFLKDVISICQVRFSLSLAIR
ncbi:hypothetical protein A9498_31025 (plasmid) [Bacillus thuringiensis serovar coreanensis]|nr:hypothetical protein A9498_31025 [Bacillus thuringiensis serovar coreanensis]